MAGPVARQTNMPARLVILSALLAAAAGQAAGQTKLAEIPLEVLAYKGELIVVGRVLEVGRPAEQELSLPGGARSGAGSPPAR